PLRQVLATQAPVLNLGHTLREGREPLVELHATGNGHQEHDVPGGIREIPVERLTSLLPERTHLAQHHHPPVGHHWRRVEQRVQCVSSQVRAPPYLIVEVARGRVHQRVHGNAKVGILSEVVIAMQEICRRHLAAFDRLAKGARGGGRHGPNIATIPGVGLMRASRRPSQEARRIAAIHGGLMPHPHSRFRAVAGAAILGVPLLAGAAASKPAIRAEGTYAILNGADTAVLERWVRSDDSLKVTMDVIGQVRLEFTASTNSDATFSNMSMQVFQPGSNEAVEEAHAEFRDDSVIARQKVQAGMDTVRRATRAGAVPYLSPSVTLTEQIVRRARAIGGDSVAVPVFVV